MIGLRWLLTTLLVAITLAAEELPSLDDPDARRTALQQRATAAWDAGRHDAALDDWFDAACLDWTSETAVPAWDALAEKADTRQRRALALAARLQALQALGDPQGADNAIAEQRQRRLKIIGIEAFSLQHVDPDLDADQAQSWPTALSTVVAATESGEPARQIRMLLLICAGLHPTSGDRDVPYQLRLSRDSGARMLQRMLHQPAETPVEESARLTGIIIEATYGLDVPTLIDQVQTSPLAEAAQPLLAVIQRAQHDHAPAAMELLRRHGQRLVRHAPLETLVVAQHVLPVEESTALARHALALRTPAVQGQDLLHAVQVAMQQPLVLSAADLRWHLDQIEDRTDATNDVLLVGLARIDPEAAARYAARGLTGIQPQEASLIAMRLLRWLRRPVLLTRQLASQAPDPAWESPQRERWSQAVLTQLASGGPIGFDAQAVRADVRCDREQRWAAELTLWMRSGDDGVITRWRRILRDPQHPDLDHLWPWLADAAADMPGSRSEQLCRLLDELLPRLSSGPEEATVRLRARLSGRDPGPPAVDGMLRDLAME